MPVGAVIGAAIGGIGSAVAASKAAGAQKDAANQQAAVQRETRDLIRNDLASYREGGTLAQQAYMHELGLGPAPTIGGTPMAITEIPGVSGGNALAGGGGVVHGSWGNMKRRDDGIAAPAAATPGRFQVGDQIFNTREEAEAYANANLTGGTPYGGYTKTPGYDFRLSEGLNALEAGAAARGGLYSGATMKALQQYGQDYATSEYQNYLARLGGLVDTGINAASMSGQASQNAAAGISNALGNKGDAISAGYVGVGNALNSSINNLIGYQQFQALLNSQSPRGTA